MSTRLVNRRFWIITFFSVTQLIGNWGTTEVLQKANEPPIDCANALHTASRSTARWLRLLSVSKLRELSCEPWPKSTHVCRLQKGEKKNNNNSTSSRRRNTDISKLKAKFLIHSENARLCLCRLSDKNKSSPPVQHKKLKQKKNCSSRELWGSGLVWRN